ncbi:right-handed parallel beta-helix repeat-containing protein [Alkalihalobacillus sp. NPDC078783]
MKEYPLINNLRKGTPDDPFIPKKDTRVVLGGRIQLSELPDINSKVTIADPDNQTWFQVRNESLQYTKFTVDYSSGFIYFDPVNDNKVLTISYTGTGFVSIPSGRVHTKSQGSNVTETLDDYTEKMKENAEGIKNSLTDNFKLIQDNKDLRDRAQLKVSEFDQKMNDFFMIPKSPVPTYDDLFIIHPTPKLGWTVQVEDENVMRRWDNHEWSVIFNLDKVNGYNFHVSNDAPVSVYDMWGATTEENYVPQSMRVRVSEDEPTINQLWGLAQNTYGLFIKSWSRRGGWRGILANGLMTEDRKYQITAEELQEYFKNGEVVKARTNLDNYTFPDLAKRLLDNDEKLLNKSSLLKAKAKYSIGGAGCDFSTINEALEFVTKHHAWYQRNQICVELVLAKGFIMKEQVLVRGLNLSWILITSEDTEVPIQRSALTTELNAEMFPAFGVTNGSSPIIGVLFNMDKTGDGTGRCGVYASDGATLTLLPKAGVKNATYKGMFANRASTINAHETIFTGAGDDGAYALNASTINANGVDASNAGNRCVRANRGSTISVHNAKLNGSKGEANVLAFHGSTINAWNAQCNNSAGEGIKAIYNSRINARSTTVNDSAKIGIYCDDSSSVSASRATVLRSKGYAIYALNNSNIDLRNAIISDSNDIAVFANRASTINAHEATITNTKGEAAVQAQHSSTINAWGSVVTGSQKDLCVCVHASRVNMKSSDLRNTKGRIVYAEGVSNVELSTCDVRNSGDAKVEITRGSHVVIFAINGTITPSTPVNELTRSGVIYQ